MSSRRVLPLRLTPGEPALVDTIEVELDDDRLANALVRVVDADAPRVTTAGLSPAGPAAERCVQAFAMVSATLGLVRHADILGKGAGWPRGAPLALRCVDPGLRGNAEYRPEYHELRLGVATGAGGETRHAAADPDVVAHEAGHAVLHALAPDLLTSWHPDSVAIHEAVADLVATLVPLQSTLFQERVLGSLAAVADSDVLAAIAEEFAAASGRPALRNLRNVATLPGAGSAATQVTTVEPHAVSEVLSGAVWTFVTQGLLDYIAAENRREFLPALGRQLRRLLLRAFVYTPPGELTLGDVGRLLVGADRVVHGAKNQGQDARLDAVLRARGVLGDEPGLDTPELPVPPLPAGGPDETWLRAVEAVVGRGRCDRRRVSMTTYRHFVTRGGGDVAWQTDVLVRLAWPALLPIGPGGEGLEVVRGATVVADEESREVRALIRTGGERPVDEARRQAWIDRLVQKGAFALQDGPTGALPAGLSGALHLG